MVIGCIVVSDKPPSTCTAFLARSWPQPQRSAVHQRSVLLRWQCHQRTASIRDRPPFILTPLHLPSLDSRSCRCSGVGQSARTWVTDRVWRCGDLAKPQPNQDATFFSQAVTVFCITHPPSALKAFCAVSAGHQRADPFLPSNSPRRWVTSCRSRGTLVICSSLSLHIGHRIRQARNMAFVDSFVRFEMASCQSGFVSRELVACA